MSHTQTLPDSEPDCDRQDLGKLQLTKADTTIIGLTIGTASLKDVETRLGPVRGLAKNGITSASNTICYVSPTDGTVLTFGAGSMGGFVDVTEFALWSREAKFPTVSECKPSNLVSRALATTSGMRLGLSINQLTGILGTRPKMARASAHYELSCRQKMTAQEIRGFKTANNWDVSQDPYFDVGSFVDVQFTSSGISHLSVAKVKSY